MNTNTLIKMMSLVLLIFLFGCNLPSSTLLNEEVTTDIIIEKDTVEKLDINIEIGYGMLDVSSGANAFVEGEVIYNIAKLEPITTYNDRRKKGSITIAQPNVSITKLDKGLLKNNWDLQLTNDVPANLEIDTGASDTTMDLRGMQLHNLDVDAGVGRTTINLGGKWLDDVEVNLDMGVGQTTIVLPKDIGVKVKAEKGIGVTNFTGLTSNKDGIYVNDAYENSDVTITVNADIGVGEANFEVEK